MNSNKYNINNNIEDYNVYLVCDLEYTPSEIDSEFEIIDDNIIVILECNQYEVKFIITKTFNNKVKR